MECKCGYNYARAALEHAKKRGAKRDAPYDSYAVVNDKDYRRFIRLEADFLAAPDRESQWKAFSRSSRYVGSLMVCPRCGMYLFLKPKASEAVFLQVEPQAMPDAREHAR